MSGLLLKDLPRQDRYKLLCAVVVQRPIALVTTLDVNGAVNAAPFSFFNVFSEDPPLIVLGLQHKPDRTPRSSTLACADHLRDENTFCSFKQNRPKVYHGCDRHTREAQFGSCSAARWDASRQALPVNS